MMLSKVKKEIFILITITYTVIYLSKIHKFLKAKEKKRCNQPFAFIHCVPDREDGEANFIFTYDIQEKFHKAHITLKSV